MIYFIVIIVYLANYRREKCKHICEVILNPIIYAISFTFYVKLEKFYIPKCLQVDQECKFKSVTPNHTNYVIFNNKLFRKGFEEFLLTLRFIVITTFVSLACIKLDKTLLK